MELSVQVFKEDFLRKLRETRGVEVENASPSDLYFALASLIKRYASENWVKCNKKYQETSEKQVYYFSMEFLMGKLLSRNLMNLGVLDICRQGFFELGINLDEIEEVETDQGLGNGGLGRLAACFMDSLASLEIPGHGCGIRYKYGFFQQKIVDGNQVEVPDYWLKTGYIWEVKKPDKAVEVAFGGRVRESFEDGRLKFYHEDYEPILAVPYDIPIIGYKNGTVNTLRLWSAEPIQREFDYTQFSRGEYVKAVENKYNIEAISQVLYPDDNHEEGKQLRLKQQYFFVSAGLQSIIRHFKKKGKPLHELDEHIAIHINDTHPTLVIPELMRILVDIEGLSWDLAWETTIRTVSYTNHTILPEALEKWPIDMFRSLLPRIYMIVYEINERFCRELWNRYPGDWDKVSRMAIIADNYVKMAHLAVAGSHSVNGVAKIHSDILKKQVMSDFYNFYPYKFNNKTNGVTHRRWLLKANPKLAALISNTIGNEWVKYPTDLIKLGRYLDNEPFLEKLREVKRWNKERLAKYIFDTYGIEINKDSIFDIHVKRIHAYKRQLLNIMNIMNLYNRLLEDPTLDIIPRTFIFAGKAAPGYRLAKQIIRLINALAAKVNSDERINNKIKVVFIEDYKVSLAEIIIAAADVSEQISTTTKEASGTGNMKFMMNGAITVATLDGANVEIRDAVGDENIVIFGLTEKQVMNYYTNGGYVSKDIYESDQRLKTIIDQLSNGFLTSNPEDFSDIVDSLLVHNDEYFVLKDFDSYVNAQDKIDRLYRDTFEWENMSLFNIARSGVFSSDRTIMEYATDIWGLEGVFKYI